MLVSCNQDTLFFWSLLAQQFTYLPDTRHLVAMMLLSSNTHMVGVKCLLVGP